MVHIAILEYVLEYQYSYRVLLSTVYSIPGIAPGMDISHQINPIKSRNYGQAGRPVEFVGCLGCHYCCHELLVHTVHGPGYSSPGYM